MHRPTEIAPNGSKDMILAWNTGERYFLPYFQLRFFCPCATCVDEMSGRRVLKKSEILPDVSPRSITPVGEYAIQVNWSDGHRTGIYEFEKLYDLCRKLGLPSSGP